MRYQSQHTLKNETASSRATSSFTDLIPRKEYERVYGFSEYVKLIKVTAMFVLEMYLWTSILFTKLNRNICRIKGNTTHKQSTIAPNRSENMQTKTCLM